MSMLTISDNRLHLKFRQSGIQLAGGGIGVKVGVEVGTRVALSVGMAFAAFPVF